MNPAKRQRVRESIQGKIELGKQVQRIIAGKKRHTVQEPSRESAETELERVLNDRYATSEQLRAAGKALDG